MRRQRDGARGVVFQLTGIAPGGLRESVGHQAASKWAGVRVNVQQSPGPRVGSWRVATLVGLLLSALAVLTSQAWNPPEHSPMDPPYPPPPLAAVIPTTDQLSAMYGDVLIPAEAGPPDSRTFLSESSFAADFRELLYKQAWHAIWLEQHAGIRGVQVAVTEYHEADEAASDRPDCAPADPLDIPLGRDWTTSVAGLKPLSEPDGTTGCLYVQVGRQTIFVQVAVVGSDHAVRAEKFLQDYATSHLDRLTLTPDDPPPQVPYSSTRIALLRSWLVAVMLLATIAIIPSLLLDRATWSRLASHLRRRTRNPRQVDIDLGSSSILARAHAVTVGRFASFLWTLRLGEILWWSGWVTTGALIAGFLLGALVQRRIMAGALRFHRTRMFTGASLIPVVIGVVIAAATVAAAAYLWVAGVNLSPLGPLAGGAPEWSVQRTALGFQVVAVIVFLWAVVPIALGRRIAMKMLRGSTPESGEPPLLLLRSFNDDRLRMRARRLDRASIIDQLVMRRWETFEEIEASALGKYGPVLAVGTPGERLPPALGAIRRQFSHEEWQARVAELCGSSTFIALNVGRSEGLIWEIDRLVKTGYLHKTIFLIPPVKAKERRLRLAVLSAVTGASWTLLDTRRTGRTVLAVCFPLGTEIPMVIVGRGPDDVDYDVAIDRCVRALQQADAGVVAELRSFEAALTPATIVGNQPTNHVAESFARIPVDIDGLRFEPGPAPPLIRVPAGKGKKTKGINWWRLAAWLWMINLVVLPFVVPFFLAGDPIGERDAKTVLALNDQYSVSSIVSVTGDQAIVVLNTKYLVRAHFDTEEFDDIGSVPRLTEFVAQDGDLVFASAPTTGEVAAVNVSTGQTVWSITLPAGQRGLAIVAGTLVVADPSGEQLTVLNQQTGQIVREAPLGCHPWDLTIAQDAMWVTCPDLSIVVQLSTESLLETARFPVPTGSNSVFPCNNTVCVKNEWEHRILPVDPAASPEVLLRVANPLVASNGPYLAVEGYEKVSNFDFGAGVVNRRLTDGSLYSLAVDAQGHVVYGDQHSLVRINK